jgi:galactokinase
MNFDIQKFEAVFSKIYGNDQSTIDKQIGRYAQLLEKFNLQFDQSDVHFFSTPGRTEIGGNHTDHNLGRVLAAGVNLDAVAVVAPNDSNRINFYSEGYDQPFAVDLEYLDINPMENGTTTALLRGIAARFKELNYSIGGFDAFCSSDVLPGSGLSSSAAIEVLIGTIFNFLFNQGRISAQEIAIIGQFAENKYFGKPCGLMDQMACAVGGVVTIDFENPSSPQVTKVDFDFSAHEYNLLVVDTGGSHADLTDDYSKIPEEMRSVAHSFNLKYCRELSSDKFFSRIGDLRKKVGDRAILRVLHFFGDNERVIHQVNALEDGDFQQFLSLVNESGNSSFKWLQNVYSEKNTSVQGVSLALALTEKYISEIKEGATRVHGGGFAGTIQVFLPTVAVEKYVELIESIFGRDNVLVLSIRPFGTLYLNQFLNNDI